MRFFRGFEPYPVLFELILVLVVRSEASQVVKSMKSEQMLGPRVSNQREARAVVGRQPSEPGPGLAPLAIGCK